MSIAADTVERGHALLAPGLALPWTPMPRPGSWAARPRELGGGHGTVRHVSYRADAPTAVLASIASVWGSRHRFGGTRVVHLHVGAPKTGTTFVQNALWRSRERLAEHGVLYPLDSPDEHFAMTMDLRRMEWAGGHDPAWDGTWDRICARIAASQLPRVVLSNELLGGASPQQIRRAVESLGDAEVHVVFTARDLARALASDWQEQIRHGHTVDYDRFVDDLVVLGRDAPKPFSEMFWDLHDPLTVLPKWAEVVGAKRVHVVTVPAPGAPRVVLLERVADVLGIAAADLETDADGPASNEALGVVEAELLRRLNDEGELPERLTWMYAGVARLELAEWILGRRSGQRRITLPGRHREWAVQHAHRTVTALRDAGYPITGELAELVPAFSDEDAGGPGVVGDEELLATAVQTLSDVLLRLGVVQNPPE